MFKNNQSYIFKMKEFSPVWNQQIEKIKKVNQKHQDKL